MDDERFLSRLPALRGGFSELAPADRRRLLDLRLGRYDERGTQILRDDVQALEEGVRVADPMLQLAARRAADMAGRTAVERLLPEVLQLSELPPSVAALSDSPAALAGDDAERPANQPPALPAGSISLADRWRLVLAVTEVQSGRSMTAASCLDQLYGYGKGEGAGDRLTPRRIQPRGGTEAPEPTVVEWADDLQQLFGADVCQEVLGEAVERGKAAAAELLDPDQVQPSIELLQQVLSLAGGLPEQRRETAPPGATHHGATGSAIGQSTSPGPLRAVDTTSHTTSQPAFESRADHP